MGDVAADTVTAGSVISLPQGGGAVGGLGEKFSPDLFTGTGNFSVPVVVPGGRLGLAPQLALSYSTGNGNGVFGLGWALGVGSIARRTSHGLPRYLDGPGPHGEAADVFVLAGADDLVPVAAPAGGRTRYRPRTEGQFARIDHVVDASGDRWEVRGRDGSVARFGTARPAGAGAGWRDPAAVVDPANPGRVFAWQLTEARDALGNVIRYEYLSDHGDESGHRWDNPLLARVSYADYGDRDDPSFLVAVEFDYEPRPDARSDRRPGFEVRTTLRCRTIRIATQTADGTRRVAREYRVGYTSAPFTGVSLLTRIDVVGIDEAAGAGTPTPASPTTEPLAPLTFTYTAFDPAGRRFEPLTGPALPAAAPGDPAMALVDLRGAGLPDLVQFDGTPRYWPNAGGGRFELPRPMAEAPPFSLADPGVQLIDADGDGRPDLLVSLTGGHNPAGYFPMAFGGGWRRQSFQPYRLAPAASPADPGVKLVDLDGDGITDVLQTTARGLLATFNDPDPRRAWAQSLPAAGSAPDVDLADPRIRLADMTGDGLDDIVLIRSGGFQYWPNLGRNRWGEPVVMRHAPRLPDGYDPRRILLGDFDGDGAADLLYVDDRRILLWGNQSGNAWTPAPIVISGIPPLVDTDHVQLADLHGTGTSGVLFSRPADGSGRPHLWFLDPTGGVKPHLLTGIDNHLGAQTSIRYGTSTQEFLRDDAKAATRWRTTLPFPVQVVSHVEVVDAISGGRLTTEYRYHHGYWDGVEREFRGFARVEQFDTESFADAPKTGPGAAPDGHFSPPTLTRSWFHPGPVAAVEAGDWTELDLSSEYWPGDAPMLTRPPETTAFLNGLARTVRRSALRAMRGHPLRSELYALDGTSRADRPYTVVEVLPGVREESPPRPGESRERVFLPVPLATRTTQWERGTEPLTQFTVQSGLDTYGLPIGEVRIAVPRGRDPRVAASSAEPYLATRTTFQYARRDDADHYLVDRVASTTVLEIVNDGRTPALDLASAAAGPGPTPAPSPVTTQRLIGHSRTFYDGEAFAGLPLGAIGEHGLPVRTETLAFTDGFLSTLFDPAAPGAVTPRPVFLDPAGVTTWPAEYPQEFRTLTAPLAGYQHYADTDVPGSPGGYYVVGARRRYDVHDPARVPRGLVIAALDPFGSSTTVGYDQHDLLAVQSTDAAGLSVTADHDYRVLQPSRVTDVNGNTSTAAYTPSGLLAARSVHGADGTGDGAKPSVRHTYDLLAFAERGQPVSDRTERRVHFDTDTSIPPGQRDETITSVQFSDGFGRIVQVRSQAEDTLFGDPVFGTDIIPAADLSTPGATTGRTRNPADPDNVVVSGLQVYDNKGQVVQKYEPYFGTDYAYAPPGADQLGRRTLIFYDPRGQAVRTVEPDASERLVVTGVPADLKDPAAFEPTPWETYTYDANDNAGRTHGAAAQAFAGSWDTPASIEVDALGRTVRSVARTAASQQPDALLTTRFTYDIQSHLLTVTDALGRQAFGYAFDLLGRRWRVDGADAGRRDTIPDALGSAIESRDSKGALQLGGFDRLHRPIRLWARDDKAGPTTLRQRIEYGDAGDPAQPASDRAAAAAVNLLGRPVRQYDDAGLVTTDRADLLGNVLSTGRRVIADAPVAAVYQNAAAKGWDITPFQVDWTPVAGQTQSAHDAALLEATSYQTTSGFDALSRITSHTYPAEAGGQRQVLTLAYDRSGAVDRIQLGGVVHVSRIAYDAKGQRSLIAYGNGTMTRHAYDRDTFRLLRTRSEQFTTADDLTYQPVGTAAVQDHGYDYDLVGNVLRFRDRTPGSGIPNNPDALTETDPVLRKLLGSGDALNRRFGYDPVYRLLTATGREFASPPTGDPWLDAPRGADRTQAKGYQEAYQYDQVNTLTSLSHTGTGGSFTRGFIPEDANDRLHRLTVGGTPIDYTYDANGNTTGEAAARHFSWNHADRLKAFATQTPGSEPSVHVQYLYDTNGERVKKLVRRQGGTVDVTHYIGEAFEHQRWGGTAPGQNNHLHVFDVRRRVALLRTGPARPGDKSPATSYQLTDHLGSSTAVLDGTGAVINREEYTPYGETSFGSFTLKRFRFLGKEREEESSLVLTSARYYAPWTARWVSCEPLGGLGHPVSPPTADVLNSYWYAKANPLRLVDPDGRAPAIGPDLTQKVPPVLGSEAHRDILPVLAGRLQYLGYDARVDTQGLAADLARNGILTAPGGSLSGKSRGELDLLINVLEDGVKVGHVYELKPARLVGSSRTTAQVNKQVRFGQKLAFPGNPLFYKPGTVLDQASAFEQNVVLTNVVVDKGEFIRVYSLWLIRDEAGRVIPGQIGYNYSDSDKQRREERQPEQRQSATDSDRDSLRESLRKTPDPPLIIEKPGPFGPVDGDGPGDSDSPGPRPLTPEEHKQAARNYGVVAIIGIGLAAIAAIITAPL
ncbi:SpvB/TcaC N-terminal domain-containing protein [Catenulispora yoronensis]